MKIGSLFSAKKSLTRNASGKRTISIVRTVSITVAFALVLLAAIAVVCMAATLAVPGDPRKGLGNLFLNAYGLLAFLVPAWFVWGATILWSPVFSPRAIFALDTSVVPFFTLAAGFYHTREFARFAENNPVLTVLGLHGFSLTIVAAALLETVVIGALAYKLFPHIPIRRKDFRYPVAPNARKTTLSEASINERLRAGTILDFAEDHPDMPRNYPAPFTVIRAPLYGEIPLGRGPELPNPVDDMILEVDPVFTESDNDLVNVSRSKPDDEVFANQTNDDLRATIESLSPALTDLDMVLNDLLAGLPPVAREYDPAAAVDELEPPVDDLGEPASSPLLNCVPFNGIDDGLEASDTF